MDEQVIKLALSVFGVEGVVKLREESARLKLGMEAAADSFAKGQTTAAEFSKATNAYARDLARVNDLLGQFERAQAAQAAETSKGTSATQAWASAVTSATSAGGGWGAVITNAGQSAAEATRKIEAEAAATHAAETAAKAHVAAIEAEAAAFRAAGPKVFDLADSYEVLDRAETQVATSARAAGAAVETAGAKAVPSVKQMGAAVDGAKDKMSGLNTAIRGIGYGISDVFSNNGPIGQKIGGFSNNISGIVSGIGQAMGKMGPQLLVLSAGLEIGFTALGAGLNALGIKSLEDIKNLFTGGVKEIEKGMEGLKARLKELEDKPVKLSMDLRQIQEAQGQLDRMEKGLAAFRAMEESRTERQQKSAAATGKVIQEAGAPGLAERLHEKAGKDIIAADPGIAIATEKAKAARARADASELAAKAQEIDDEIMKGWRAMSERIARPPRAPGAPVVPTEQLRKQADAAIAEAKAADEALNKRLAEIKGPKGEAAVRVGEAREAAAKGDVGPLGKALRGIGRGDLTAELEQTTPAAMKLQEEAKKTITGWVDEMAGAADTALKLHLKGVRHEAATTAAMKANIERAKGIPEGREVPEPLELPRPPRAVTVPQKRAKALQEALSRKRAAQAAKDEATARRRAALGQQVPGQMRAPKGFRAGVPMGAKRAPTLERPAAAPRPVTAAEAEAQAERDAETRAMIARAKEAQAARRQSVQAAIDRAKAQDAERRRRPLASGFPSVPASDPAASQAVRAAGVGVATTQMLAANGAQVNAQVGALINTVGNVQQAVQRMMRDTAVNTRSLQRMGR